MLEFGLTGGIGSGKSTVSALLAERGAVIIDADAIVRGLQQPGELVFDAMVAQWGPTIVQEDGTLDRAAVAAIVFSDADELQTLNGIVHPAVAAASAEIIEGVDGTDALVVHDIPLLILPGGEVLSSRDRSEWAGIVVVDTPEELAIDRVMASRGMEREAVEARMATQASREERRAVADFVVDNSGDFASLEAEVDRCWAWMQTRSGATSSPLDSDLLTRPDHANRPGETVRSGEQSPDGSSDAEN